MKVIIAEDDLVSRTVLEGLLKKNGYNVVGTYSSGRSALAALSQNPDIQIAIIDWLMPEMSGIEVCKQLIAKGIKDEKQVLLVSVQEEKHLICEGLDSGADDYITKPYNDAELISRLKVAERRVKAYEKLKQYTLDLETLARRNNLLGGLTGKMLGASEKKPLGTPGTQSPIESKDLSTAIASLPAAVQFESTVKTTLEGLGLSDLSAQIITTPQGPKEEPGFIAWAPLYFGDKNTWLEVLIESTKPHAQAIVGAVLDEKEPSDQSIIDLFSEFTNVIRGSSKSLCSDNEVINPFVPLALATEKIGTYLALIQRKRCLQVKYNNALLNTYLIEHEGPPSNKTSKTIASLDIVAKAVCAKDTPDQILLPKWTILNQRLIEKIANYVQSDMAEDTLSIVSPSPLAYKMNPNVG